MSEKAFFLFRKMSLLELTTMNTKDARGNTGTKYQLKWVVYEKFTIELAIIGVEWNGAVVQIIFPELNVNDFYNVFSDWTRLYLLDLSKNKLLLLISWRALHDIPQVLNTSFLSYSVSLKELNTSKFHGQLNSLWKAHEKHEILVLFLNYR